MFVDERRHSRHSLNEAHSLQDLKLASRESRISTCLPSSSHRNPQFCTRMVNREAKYILCRILRKLGSPEKFIAHLSKLNIKVYNEVALIARLDKCEATIDSYVNPTKSEMEQLRDAYQDTVVFMWMKYANIKIIPALPDSETTRLDWGQLLSGTFTVVPGPGVRFEEPPNPPVQSIDDFLAEWENKFKSFNQVKFIDEQQMLLQLVAKAIHYSRPFEGDSLNTKCKETLFKVAYSCLFQEIKDKYLNWSSLKSGQDLADLAKFLQKEIFAYYDIRYAQEEANLGIETILLKREGTYCDYCGHSGTHTRDWCNCKRWTLCGRCFEFDHHESFCTAYYTKETFLKRVQEVVAEMDEMEDTFSVDQLKQLLLLTGKVDTLMAPFLDDRRLQNKILVPIVERLPFQMRALFANRMNASTTINDLHCDLYTKGYLKWRREFSSAVFSFCAGCFKLGHFKEECPNPRLPRLENLN